VPTYQYACTECGHSFDIVQSFSDDSLSVCPECGGRLRKVFNAVGVVFKGSGFYRTDSRGKQSADTGSSSSGNGSGDSSSSTTKTSEKSSSNGSSSNTNGSSSTKKTESAKA